jgi:ferredoxin
MTPFGIRKRIKRLISGARGGSTAPEQGFDVAFVLPDGSTRSVRTEAQYTLTMASQLLETPIDTPCPDGHCGLCQVRILEGLGSLAPESTTEAEILDKVLGPGRDKAIRLACHARLRGPGVKVAVQKVWRLEEIRGNT